MLSTTFIILAILLAVLWLIFVVKSFIIKVEVADSRLMFITTWLMAVIGVYCAFTVVTNCGEITFLESLKNPTPLQEDRLHYLIPRLVLTTFIGYALFGVHFILSKIMKKRLQREIGKNSSSNDKWNI